MIVSVIYLYFIHYSSSYNLHEHSIYPSILTYFNSIVLLPT